MDVGAQLRRAREERDLSLSDLSQITKIRVALLKALENNEPLTSSGDFYTRGFLRAYAVAVGLNPEEIVRGCLAQEADIQLGSAGGARQAEEGGAGQGRAERQRASRARVLLGAGVAAVALILYVLWFGGASRTSIPAPPLDSSKPAVATAGTKEPLREPALAGADAETSSNSAVGAAVGFTTLTLQIRANKECWLAASADGQRVAYRLMLAGDQETIRAQDGISLGLGSAGALTMFLNGAPVRSLGEIGEVVSVRMTRENYRSFLSP
jgi:cytoskeleton protein RodZ